MKNTYWFTLASGSRYDALVADLKKSTDKLDVDLHIIQPTGSVEEIKKCKPQHIIDVADSYERVVFLDADTLLISTDGFDTLNGSLAEPWGMGNVPWVAPGGSRKTKERRITKLCSVLEAHDLKEFLPGQRFNRQEWNSGVISGNGNELKVLAERWLYWWDIVNECCDGEFRRDQIPYKFAYYEKMIPQYGWNTFPVTYNWIVKRLGFGDIAKAKVVHLAGRPDRRVKKKWGELKAKVLV